MIHVELTGVALERKIIERGLEFQGLVSDKEYYFLLKLSRLPARLRLSLAQRNWLFDIAEKKLELVFERPAQDEIIDYKSRACA